MNKNEMGKVVVDRIRSNGKVSDGGGHQTPESANKCPSRHPLCGKVSPSV
jgi:hypothetical protein